MVEQTQEHFSALGINKPAHLATDQWHVESSVYAFMDYNILDDEDDQDDQEDIPHECCTYLIWRTILTLYSEYHIDPINNPDATESVGLCHDIHCWYEQEGTISVLSDILLCMGWLMIKGQAFSSIDGLVGKQLCFRCKDTQKLYCSDSAATKVPGYAT